MRFFVGWRLSAFCAVAGLGVGFGGGYYLRDLQAKAAANRALKDQVVEANQQIKREQQSDAATQATGEAVAERVETVRWRTRTLIREIPVYVTPDADSQCTLTDGFVRLHDAAAAGTAPVPFGPGESPDAPSGVVPSSALATVAQNYGDALVWREQVVGWQEWYRTQQALWSGQAPVGVGTPGSAPPVP